MVKLISRKQWGARPPTRPLAQVPWSRRVGVAVHYSQGNRDDTPLELQRYAQNSLGYADGHYNILVDYLGRAYEGRGWTVSAAHSEGENVEWVGICFIGRDSHVTPAAMATITALIEDAHTLAGRMLKLAGHQELPGAQTSCPGPRLMTLVDRLRSGGDDMSAKAETQIAELHAALIHGSRSGRAWTHTPPGGESQPINPLYNALWRVERGLTQLGAQLPDVVPIDVDEDAIVAGILATLTPEAIADAIGPEVAADVVDLLRAKLAS